MKTGQRQLALSISAAIWSGAFALASLPQQAIAQSTEAATPAVADDAGIARVTVTAQNRTQQLQDVPIDVQVIKEDAITKLAANNLGDINGYIPGLHVDDTQATQPNYSIRGIGSGDTFVGTDAPVGIYVDGVYAGKTGGALMNFNDVERVEILKGPQGTLFGRNSAAGAISVITKEPGNEFENEYNARVGEYGEKYIDTLLNVPLSDSTAFRFNFVDHRSNGWLSDANTGESLNDQGDWGTRAQFKWTGADRSKLVVSWEHESLNQQARPEIGLLPTALQYPQPPFPANPATFVNPFDAPAYNNLNAANNVERRLYNGATVRYEYPLDWATFDSITGYRHFNSVNITNNSGTTAANSFLDTGNQENNTTWQQEFRLSGKNGLVDWLGGASFYHEAAKQQSQVITNSDTLDTIISNTQAPGVYPLTVISQLAAIEGVPASLLGSGWQENMNNVMTSNSYAVYGDAIWHLTSKLNLTTGLRFSHDSKDFSWFNPPRTAPGLDASIAAMNQANVIGNAQAAGFISPQQAGALQYVMSALGSNIEYTNPATSTTAYSTSNSWSDTSPRLVLDYKFTPDVMMFGSATKGYQSGGFNAQAVGGSYSPEQMRNYEIGLKSYFPEQHLEFNASLFYYQFTNLQSLALVATNSPIPQYQVTTSDQNGKGADIETAWKVSRNLRLTAVAEFLDKKYGTYTDPNGVNLSGQAVDSPLWSASAGIDYTQRDVADGSINYSLQHAYTGAKRCNAEATFQGNCLMTDTINYGGPQQRTDARIAWDSVDHKWGIGLYVTNLLNNRYITGIDTVSSTVLGTASATISAPRIVGVQLHYSL